MLNRVILIGRMTAEPEFKTTPSGVMVASFTLAVDRQGKDKGTDFINIVAWRRNAEFICRYFGKGDPITVEGRIQVKSYTTQEGQKRKVVEVVADQVGFVLTSAKKESTQGTERANPQPNVEVSVDEFIALSDGEDMPF